MNSNSKELTSVYKGGKTAEFVYKQILARWGQEAADAYDPLVNCFTYVGWQQRGFQVKRGEKALDSWTVVEVEEKNPDTGKHEIVDTFKKSIKLFYHTQVKELESEVK